MQVCTNDNGVKRIQVTSESEATSVPTNRATWEHPFAVCLIVAAGLHLPVPDGATAREQEIRLEDDFLNHGLVQMTTSQRIAAVGDADMQWHFHVSHPVDAEDALLARVDVSSLTKVALARQLVLRDGGSWRRLFAKSKAELAALFLAGVAGHGCCSLVDPLVYYRLH